MKYKDTIRNGFLSLWNDGRMATVDDLFAKNYVNHDTTGMPKFEGIEGVKKSVQQYRAAFPGMKLEVLQALEEGNLVAIHWRAKGTHGGEFAGVAATGKSVTVHGNEIYRIENGKIAESWTCWDALSLLQQVGKVQKLSVPATAA